MLISLTLLKKISPKTSLSIYNTPEDLEKDPLKIFDHFRSPGFFLFFSSDFACMDYFVYGGFVLVLLRMRVLQSPVGFQRQNCT